MVPQDVVAALRAVVRFIQTTLHEEGEAAEHGADAAADGDAPGVGGVAALQVDDGGDGVFAAGAGHGGRVVVGG